MPETIWGNRLNRRRALGMLGIPAMSSWGIGAASRQAPAVQDNGSSNDSDRPNAILIVTDDLDAQSAAMLPHITDLLIRQGTSFANCFVTDPSCGPSRASILRGQYVHNHGMLSNGGETGGFPVFRERGNETSTLATWLHDAGYRTGLFGKYLNGYPDGAPANHVPPGWDEWFALVSTHYTRFKFNDNGLLDRAGRRPEDYQTDLLAERARAFIAAAAAAGDPFFAYIAPKAPHDPSEPAPRHQDAFADALAPRPASFNESDLADKPAYVRENPELSEANIAEIDERYRQRLRTMLAVDDMVAGLIDTLERSGVLDHTVIVFTSDNGFFSGEHRLSYGKGLPYDESLRVPLIVRGPGIGADRIEQRLVNNADLAPTIAELAGAAIPDFVDGRPLTPLLRGEMSLDWRQVTLVEDIGQLFREDEESEFANGEESGGGDAEADPRGERGVVPAYRALRSLDWLYVDYATGERELYDMQSDPYQLENLAATANASLIEHLAERLDALARCAGNGCRELEDAPLDLD